MPGNRKPIVFLRKKFRELMKPGWIEPKPVYAACSLLLIAGLIMLSLSNEMKEVAMRQPETPFAEYTEAVEYPQKAGTTSSQTASGERKEIQPANETLSATVNKAAILAASTKQEAQWPVKGNIILDFGWQFHSVYKDWRYHTGIDIGSGEGLFVVAMLPGQVTDIYSDSVTGLTTVIRSGKYIVYYGSLAAVNVSLQKGSYVDAGDKIGTVGTCRAEPYTHLHLAIKEGDMYIDPHRVLKSE